MEFSPIEIYCTDNDIKYDLKTPLSEYTSMKVGGICDIMVFPQSEDAIRGVISFCVSHTIPYVVLGKGSNVIFGSKGYGGCVIRLDGWYSGIRLDGDNITALAGTSIRTLCQAALNNGLSGLEFAYGIPGSAGGALYMNAGAFGGEIKDVVKECRYIDESGEVRVLTKDEMELSYRKSFFTGKKGCISKITFSLKEGDRKAIKAKMDDLLARRRAKQPLEYPSCGSTFKRPEGYYAAALIEECGLKGYTVGGAQVSEKHSGFVINRGGAVFEDVMSVINEVKRVVKEKKGVSLECEPLIIDQIDRIEKQRKDV